MTIPKKRTRKSSAIIESINGDVTDNIETIASVPKKRGRKPSVLTKSIDVDVKTDMQTPANEPKKRGRKPSAMSKLIKENGHSEDIKMLELNPQLHALDLEKMNRCKVFRSISIEAIPCDENRSLDSIVVCAKCDENMTWRHYFMYHRATHYFLCWLKDEEGINLDDANMMKRIISENISPITIKNRLVRLTCDKCHKEIKSVAGYVSHIVFCSKENVMSLRSQCLLCDTTLKPFSKKSHYTGKHKITDPIVVDKDTFNETFWDGDVIFKPLSSANSTPSFECMAIPCDFVTQSKDELKMHVLNCKEKFYQFKCLMCNYQDYYKSAILYHTTNDCESMVSFMTASLKQEMKIEDVDEDGGGGEGDTLMDENETRKKSNRIKKPVKFYNEGDSLEDDEPQRRKNNAGADYDPTEDTFLKDEEADEMYECVDDEGPIFGADDNINGDVKPKRRSATFRKNNGQESFNLWMDNEDCGFRRAFNTCLQNMNGVIDSLQMTHKARNEFREMSSLVKKVDVDVDEWEPFFAAEEYLPSVFRSVKMMFSGDRDDTKQYNLFESDLVQDECIAFTGGPVWAMAWLPLPDHVTEQYLAVASQNNVNEVISIAASVSFPSIVQLWKIDQLPNVDGSPSKPQFVLGIAHDHGLIKSMEWCPSGGVYQETTLDSPRGRLGTLAVATSSGNILVYSVPKILHEDELDFHNKITKPEPDLFLKVKYNNVQCSKIVWLRNFKRCIICAGYSNGCVAFFDVSGSSTILRQGKVLFPYKTFQAHAAAITAMDAHWMEGGRYIVTSSMDRIIKHWDIEDLAEPMYENERLLPITDLSWFHHWNAHAFTTDQCSDCYSDRGVGLLIPRHIDKKKNVITPMDTYWSSSYSPWNDTLAFCSNSGKVALFAAKRLVSLAFKSADFQKLLTEVKWLPLDMSSLVIENDDKTSSKSKKKAVVEKKDNEIQTPLVKVNLEEEKENYILQFSYGSKENFGELYINLDESSITSANHVRWNENYNSFNWLAIGYECGLVRLIRVNRFDKYKLAKFYKSNETYYKNNAHDI